jgi:hypothetical protein
LRHGNAQQAGRSLTYGTWVNMRARCFNKASDRFAFYGAKGVAICDRWAIFENFLEDMGQRPSDRHTLDRVDPGKDYSPDNCRWATWKEQQRNRSNNRVMTLNGVTASLAELCELNGCNYKTVHRRLTIGVPLEQAMTTERLKNRKLASSGQLKLKA